MKVNYTNKKLNVEIDADSAKEAFKKLAEFQEVFDETSCGLCKGEEIQFVVRNVEGNDYYELKCRSCGGKLAFGQHKSGNSLFPKRKEHYETKGWHKWKPES